MDDLPVELVRPLLLCITEPLTSHSPLAALVLILMSRDTNWGQLDQLLHLRQFLLGNMRLERRKLLSLARNLGVVSHGYVRSVRYKKNG